LDRMEARISARLDSVIEKLDTHFLINKNHFDHHTVILHEHDDRLKDLERQTGTCTSARFRCEGGIHTRRPHAASDEAYRRPETRSAPVARCARRAEYKRGT